MTGQQPFFQPCISAPFTTTTMTLLGNNSRRRGSGSSALNSILNLSFVSSLSSPPGHRSMRALDMIQAALGIIEGEDFLTTTTTTTTRNDSAAKGSDKDDGAPRLL